MQKSAYLGDAEGQYFEGWSEQPCINAHDAVLMAPSISFTPKKRCIPFQHILTPKLPLLLYSKHLYLTESLILKQQSLAKSTPCNAQGQTPAFCKPLPKFGRSESWGRSVTNDLCHHNPEQLGWSSDPDDLARSICSLAAGLFITWLHSCSPSAPLSPEI